MDRPADAEKYLERAVRLKPDSVDAHAALVSCLRKGKKADSERQLQKAFTVQRHVQRINEILIEKLPKQPKDAALHAEVGKRFLAIGEERRGVEWLRRALEITVRHYGPDHPAARTVRRNLLLLRDKLAGSDATAGEGPAGAPDR